MRTAIYARFSTQLQKDSSIEDQVRICTERAEREGWQITQVFSDYAISGAVRDRPGLNALIEHIRAGEADQVLAEAIDRISRDLEDLAALHKQIRFAGARIFTLTDGVIDELQIGFKGTQASLFRSDNAAKIRRGLSGRIAKGLSAGNVPYGFRKVHRLDARGEAERGLREIDPEQADIVRRIVREYLDGDSPLAIARRLNAERVPSPAGGKWSVSAINGDAVRGNGILCNEIYIGQLVYNRTHMARDPETRRRVPRVNPPDQWQRVAVPELRIVDQDSWDAVRARKALRENWSFDRHRRPKKLLSGLVRCGSCGGNVILVANGQWGCANARRTGTCANRRTITNEALERRVLDGLRTELLSPERVSDAVRAYHEERARLEREDALAAARQRKRVDQLAVEIDRLVTAIAAGAGDIPEVVARLQEARAERESIAAELNAGAAAHVIRLHPSIADAYRAAVEQLTDTIAGDDEVHREINRALRALVDAVILTPKENRRGVHVDIDGRLQNMLALATGQPIAEPACTIKVVAEEGLEPPTRGL